MSGGDTMGGEVVELRVEVSRGSIRSEGTGKEVVGVKRKV